MGRDDIGLSYLAAGRADIAGRCRVVTGSALGQRHPHVTSAERRQKVKSSHIQIRLDGLKEIARVARDIERGDPPTVIGGKTIVGGKFILGHAFIEAMEGAGLVPKGTSYCRITAEVGQAVRLDYEMLATSEILAVPAGLVAVEDPSDAGTP